MMDTTEVDITLIRPPVCIPKSTVALRDGLPSLSLAALSASLKRAGFIVSVIDSFIEGHDQVREDDEGLLNIFGLSLDEIISRIPEKTKAVGLSLMYTHEHFYSMELLGRIIEARPNCKIILGGEHATFFCEYILSDFPQVYACALGEGDVTIIELMRNILGNEGDEGLRNIAGIAYLRDKEVFKTPDRQRIKDLSSLPRLDWDACNIRKYLDNKISLASMGKRVMPMLGSRGCPYKCTFCSISRFWGDLWCVRPVSEVVDEIERYVQDYKIDAIEFYDPSLVIGKKWIGAFARELIARGVNIRWEMPIGTRSEAFDYDIFLLLKESGLSRVNYAPESGSEKVLSDIQKKCTPGGILNSAREALKAGLYVRMHMIMGTPNQDARDLYHDFGFITRAAWIGVHDVSVFPFVVFPGTKIYDELKETGVLETEDYKRTIKINSTSNPKGSYSWNKNFNRRMVFNISMIMMVYFYFLQYLFRPWRLVWLISNYHKERSITAVDRYIYYMLKRRNTVFRRTDG